MGGKNKFLLVNEMVPLNKFKLRGTISKTSQEG